MPKSIWFPDEDFEQLVALAKQAGFRVSRGRGSQLRLFVMEAASKGSRYFVVNRFPDAVPNALSDALQCLYSVEHSFATDESYCVCPQSLIPVFGNSPAECPYCHQPRR